MIDKITPEQYAIAACNKIGKGNLIERVRRYEWDIQKAITDPVRHHEKHGNWPKVAANNDIGAGTYYARVKNGWPPSVAATERVDRSRRPKMYRPLGD